jgi:hypothetical protein
VTPPKGGFKQPAKIGCKYHPFFSSVSVNDNDANSHCILFETATQQGGVENITRPSLVEPSADPTSAVGATSSAMVMVTGSTQNLVVDKEGEGLGVPYSQAKKENARTAGAKTQLSASVDKPIKGMELQPCIDISLGCEEVLTPLSPSVIAASHLMFGSGSNLETPRTQKTEQRRSSAAISSSGNLSPSETGSVFVDGKRRSARANNSYNADGIAAADELIMDKAMKRAATKNLDGLAANTCKSPTAHSHAGNTSPLLFNKFTEETCNNKLNAIGVFLGDNSNAINISYNALKRVEIDRAVVQAHKKEPSREVTETNPFDPSDEEDASVEEALLSHLVKEVTDVDYDDSDLTTRICDLKASVRKSKSSVKKAKARRRSGKRYKSVSP